MIRRILGALLPIAAVVLIGTFGYWAIWQMSLIDSLYMTTITVATVGYREIIPPTDAMKLFNIFIIVAGVAAGGYAVSRIIDIVLVEQMQGAWEARRMNKRIEDLRGHTIITGTGRVGSVVAEELACEHKAFVIVDSCNECIESARNAGWLHVQGDATEEDVLRRAGIAHAGSLVTALDTDAENLFAVVTARALNPDIFIIARSSHQSTEEKMLKAGANRVMTPNVIGGRRMATMVLHPTVSDYLDLVAHGSGLEFRLQEVEIRADSRLHDVTIAGAAIRERTGAYVLAVRHRDGRIETNPNADTIMHSGDRLVVLGTGHQVDSLLALM